MSEQQIIRHIRNYLRTL